MVYFVGENNHLENSEIRWTCEWVKNCFPKINIGLK